MIPVQRRLMDQSLYFRPSATDDISFRSDLGSETSLIFKLLPQ